MTHTPHGLPAEFPDDVERMQELRKINAHFAKLSDDYDEVNQAVHRAETDIEPTSDDHMAELRKKRMALKDEVHSYLKR